jgi:hypothetical protein
MIRKSGYRFSEKIMLKQRAPKSPGKFSGAFFGRYLLLILTHDGGELVVIFGDKIDIGLVLDRRLRRL